MLHFESSNFKAKEEVNGGVVYGCVRTTARKSEVHVLLHASTAIFPQNWIWNILNSK
jgi:hypothetical protein